MSILLLDIGNTRVKAAWSMADGVLDLVDSRDSNVDTLAHWLDQLAADRAIAAIWASNVAGSRMAGALEAWGQRSGVDVRLVQSQARQLGVRCAYADPARLGVDRWMVVLAVAQADRNALIVDAGTACTIDAVDASGQHLGGLILPGVRLARSALNQRTHFSADDVATNPLPALGNDTNPAVTLGAVHALLGAIARTRASLAWGADCALLITGGEADVLLPHLEGGWHFRPHLVLEGLQRVARENAEQIR